MFFSFESQGFYADTVLFHFMIKFISNEVPFTEVLSRVTKVSGSLWVGLLISSFFT